MITMGITGKLLRPSWNTAMIAACTYHSATALICDLHDAADGGVGISSVVIPLQRDCAPLAESTHIILSLYSQMEEHSALGTHQAVILQRGTAVVGDLCCDTTSVASQAAALYIEGLHLRAPCSNMPHMTGA